ncbi:type I DNA topoisomerase [Natronospirillum operosum]|uniref:DNA topoisomerase 1 n=1 Tax=Natronospirillum operosum TaxID=2759953 RepID=A0A4Z0WKF4_9GAMM|nr:type I DNA topoisomerase [Natronospirillum operosum]TGG95705.1 type I DNA topoisomerase [Natronospirillum operosum]
MGKSLVIVESPAKAKTINKYLGNQFVVKSSVGHIRDLPTSGQGSKADPKERARQAAATRALPPEEKEQYKKKKAHEQLIARMGVDPDNNWSARYEILPGKEKVVDELRRLARDADQIYLATDLDREGEAIAWHLKEAIGDVAPYKRVVFSEITKKAIQEAFSRPSDLNVSRVNAQQARRFLDRIVGYMVSPLLWKKVARGLSAGRVQSVAVRLIVEKEQDIRKFVPEEYWDTLVDTRTAGQDALQVKVHKVAGEDYRPTNEADTRQHEEALRAAGALTIADRSDRPTQSRPHAPFITSTLQQAASNRLGFSVKKTMMMAQRLYEAGHITYMRTDSTNLSADAVETVRTLIRDEYGQPYLPEKPNRYSSQDGAQEAHEAIRPTDATRRSAALQDMEQDALRLYDLIWRRFVACQMTPAQYLSTAITAEAGSYQLRAKGRILKFDGYTRVMSVPRSNEDQELPDVKVGENLAVDAINSQQHFTKPPARFTEATLVKELEKRGIGRPSTYASIISTIQDRGYVKLENRRFYAEKMGEIVTHRLAESFTDLMNFDFTARMEETLDGIANGERNWKEELDRFYRDFSQQLERADSAEQGMRANAPTATDIECPACGRHMMIRTGSTGVFLGCSGYNLPPKERCKQTLNLLPADDFVEDQNDDEAEARELRQKRRCHKCEASMDAYILDEGRKLHICGNNPDCDGFQMETGRFRLKGYDGPTLECDKCGSEMQLKTGRFGKYFDCTNSECRNTRKLLRNGEPAPPKMDPVPMPELQCQKVDDTYVLRDGAAGLFLAASQFPKNRETRAPLLQEILPHKDEIDPKYSYLFSGPTEDDQGNPTLIRYARKTQEHYLSSEKEGKDTKWRAFCENGRWVEQKPKKKAAAKKKPVAKKATARKSTGKGSSKSTA